MQGHGGQDDESHRRAVAKLGEMSWLGGLNAEETGRPV